MEMKRNEVSEFFSQPENYLHKDFGVKVRAQIVHELIGDISDKNILDIGCGDGRISLQYQDSNSLTLVDQSQEMLDLTSHFIHPAYKQNVKVFNSSLETLKAPADSFDIVICMGLLAHLENWQHAISRISEITMTHGRVAIQISDSSRWLTRLQLAPKGNRTHQLNQITFEVLLENCKRAGLTLVAHKRFGFLLPGMGKFPNNFLLRYTRFSANSILFKKINTEVIAVFEKTN